MKIKGYDENAHDGLPRLPKPRTMRAGPVYEDGSFKTADGRVYDPNTKKLRKVRAKRPTSNLQWPNTERS